MANKRTKKAAAKKAETAKKITAPVVEEVKAAPIAETAPAVEDVKVEAPVVAEVKTEAPAAPVKEEAPKAKKTAEKKPVEKNAEKPAAPKKAAEDKKEAPVVEQFIIQSGGKDYTMADIKEACKEAYKNGTRKHVKSVDVYLKSENGNIRAYYVINGKADGAYIDL